MKFGFLIDTKSFSCSCFEVSPVSEIESILHDFYQAMNVSNGWIYGPEMELRKTGGEELRFKARGPIRPSEFFGIKPTHQITSSVCREEHLRFLILGYGFLQGLYLTPEGGRFLGRAAYEPGKLNGLQLSGDDYVNGMEAINSFYISSSTEEASLMFSSIHWYLLGQAYDFEWDRFEAQYKVLDCLYKLSGIKGGNHASRPVALAQKLGVKIPHWAKLSADGKKSKLSILRNELVHEAKYEGLPIGYNYPEVNYSLELSSFNTKLIASMLGIATDYLGSDPENRCCWAWNIRA